MFQHRSMLPYALAAFLVLIGGVKLMERTEQHDSNEAVATQKVELASRKVIVKGAGLPDGDMICASGQGLKGWDTCFPATQTDHGIEVELPSNGYFRFNLYSVVTFDDGTKEKVWANLEPLAGNSDAVLYFQEDGLQYTAIDVATDKDGNVFPAHGTHFVPN